MSYVDEHTNWLISKGVGVLPEADEGFRGLPLPVVDPGLLEGLPTEVALWYEARLCGRVSGDAVAGVPPHGDHACLACLDGVIV